jgi:hypothetical protein
VNPQADAPRPARDGSARSGLPPAVRRFGLPLLLALFVLSLHANALGAFFTGDDFDILRMILEREGLADVARMQFAGNWGPLSYVQFYFDWVAGGFDPRIYHLTNLLWLGVTLAALYGFVRSAWPGRTWAAWAAVLLFATHPANDQAVSYLCARSHTIGAALALSALALYARLRLQATTPAGRTLLWTGSVLAALLGGLSKETALTLPVWIAVFEWLFVRRAGETPLRPLFRGAIAGAAYGLAIPAVLGARRLVQDSVSPKLEEASGDALQSLLTDVPVYTLVGGLPFPFAWIDDTILDRILVAGWLVFAVSAGAAAACAWAGARSRGHAAPFAPLFALGWTIAATTLLPVILVGLSAQRRYLFIANVGVVLMATAVLAWLHERRRGTVRVLVALLVVAGAIGTVQRNQLHHRAGDVARNLVETVLGHPVADLPTDATGPPAEPRSYVFLTLPRFWGGDRMSGAHVMHRTDLYSALRMFERRDPVVHLALQTYHAEDYTANVEFRSATELELTVSFRTRRAYEEALARDPDEDRRRDAAVARLIAQDERARTLVYGVKLSRNFWYRYRRLFVYSDGTFTRLDGPPSASSSIQNRSSPG